jgi:5-oxoprolinase (ATP-hydrolysing)
MGKWQFWVDRGGTFTDIVGRQPRWRAGHHQASVGGPRPLLRRRGRGDPAPQGRLDASHRKRQDGHHRRHQRAAGAQGRRVLLLITEGFGDLLRIGTQRGPACSIWTIRLPELLYERGGRGARNASMPTGAEIAPLDEAGWYARRSQRAHAAGIRSVAIAFMHSYLNPAHEAARRDRARDRLRADLGQPRGQPLIKLVGRGDTAVVDAYLSPILRRYVDQVADALDLGGGCERLLFMQSNGGLTDAQLFQGKDAILSGPAGGVVGMVRTGRARASTG